MVANICAIIWFHKFHGINFSARQFLLHKSAELVESNVPVEIQVFLDLVGWGIAYGQRQPGALNRSLELESKNGMIDRDIR